MSNPNVTLRMEFAGRGAGWTTVSDWLVGSIEYERGFPGTKYTDLVADGGGLQFKLDNSPNNSARLIGYYTPGHANCRSGFGEGIGVQILVGAVTRWTGTLDQILPAPGKFGERTAACSCVGWFELAAEARLSNLPVLVSQEGDDVFQALIDAVPTFMTPRAVSKDAKTPSSANTYPYTLDRTRDEQTRLREELVRLCMSGMDRCWEKGDGTIQFESRDTRIAAASSVDTFTDHHGFDAVRSMGELVNQAQAVISPRSLGSAGSTMFETSSRIQVLAGETVVVLGAWTDPNNPTVRVAAVTLISLASGTDYSGNTAADGSGSDQTASLTVSVGLSGNATEFTVRNNYSAALWVYLRQRGTPLISFQPVALTEESASSVASYGVRPQSPTLNMPYQSDPVFASNAAKYALVLRRTPRLSIKQFRRRISFGNTAELARSLNRDISDRITIVDATSAASGQYYIERISEKICNGYLETVWDLSVTNPARYWRLGVTGEGELGVNTAPGIKYFSA